jgi:hypothetical protein
VQHLGPGSGASADGTGLGLVWSEPHPDKVGCSLLRLSSLADEKLEEIFP